MADFETFRTLHRPGRPLILANAWDVSSARVIEEAGAAAIATTSAGVSWSAGTPDGGGLDRDRALDLVARVAAAVRIPVTADIESGLAATPGGVADTIKGVVSAGAAGVNLEDSAYDGGPPLLPVREAAERVAAARSASTEVFINARVDTYLRSAVGPDELLAETLARADAYIMAGADGVFVPGVSDPDLITALVKAIRVPLNILAGPGSPSVPELAALGVARVSIGSTIARLVLSTTRTAAAELFATGTYASMTAALPYAEVNDLLGG